MARLYFLKIMSSNNKKTILDEKKCVGRKNEKMEETMTPNWFLFSLFTFTTTLATIHNITTDLGDLLPTAPHKISFSDPHWATPNLCLGLLIFQRRASDGQIFQQAFFFRLLKKKLSVLPHSSSNIALGPSALFRRLWALNLSREKLEFCTSVWRPHKQTPLHLETGSHGTCDAFQNIFVTSARFLPSTCSSKPFKKKLLPKFLFIIATFSLIIHNLIVQMSSNHAFSW